MAAPRIADLDVPARPPSLLRRIDPNSMIFLFRGQTRLQLANALSIATNQPLPHSSRVWLLSSEFEVFATFIVCCILLYKKRALGKFWIFTKRESRHGNYFVANAVLNLVLAVTIYLVAWNSIAIVCASFSFANVSTMQWWWTVPLPWLPLIIGAYTSAHGFALGCSPRSPFSAIDPNAINTSNKWYLLPIPKSAALLNTLLILPCIVFTSSTVSLVVMSGHSYYRARDFAHQHLPSDLLLQMRDYAGGRPASLADPDALASDELIWLARNVAARYMMVHRYVSINLICFAVAALLVFCPYLFYGIPNIVNLVDHTCSRYSQALPASCTTFPRKLWFLVTKGRPTSTNGAAHLNLASWKMTILSVIYLSILLICVPSFGFIPLLIIFDTWPTRVARGDIRSTVSSAIVAVSIISILSCTFVALFCGVTLDPLFRAAIGLNFIRTQIPINIHVDVHQIQAEEHDRDGGEPNYMYPPGKVYIHPIAESLYEESHDVRTKAPPSLTLKPSNSTLSSTTPSPTLSDLPAYPLPSNEPRVTSPTSPTNQPKRIVVPHSSTVDPRWSL